MLLQRAFFDCNRIRLEGLPGGKASDGVFLVHAWCDATTGPRPLPFFVKFGHPDHIERERQVYQSHVELYIPFNLRPNLDRRRCVRGSKYSALVGNFVEDAIPLRTILRQKVGSGVLFSLFETSLKGFRLQSFARNPVKLNSGLGAWVKERARCAEIRKAKEGAKILALAKKEGLKTEPEAIEAQLSDKAHSLSYWWGPIHGAILIDFGSVSDGPLIADPATLEVSLVFGTDAKDDPNQFDQWKDFVDSAYECIPVVRPPNPQIEPSEFDWLRQSLRELRHVLFGCDCNDAESMAVLAAYLLRMARLEIDTLKDPKLHDLAIARRGYALLIAERMVNAIPPPTSRSQPRTGHASARLDFPLRPVEGRQNLPPGHAAPSDVHSFQGTAAGPSFE